jgi:MFS family permease
MLFGLFGGWLSDRFSVRGLTGGGMLVLTGGFLLLMLFPANFSYTPFAVVLFVIGSAFGVFASPNSAAVMNALPREFRGVGSGMRSTFQSAGSPLSMAVFFSIVVFVLASQLPPAMRTDLTGAGVPEQPAEQAATVPPTGALFAAFLGYNPMETLLPKDVLNDLPPAEHEEIVGKQFFPELISTPLVDALRAVFAFSALLAFLAAIASFGRGARFIHEDSEVVAVAEPVLSQPGSAGGR